jgi:DNA-binding NarL/FixJ family response regulator
MQAKTNVLIVDDHPVYRSGLRNVLSKTHFFSRIYEAENGIEALEVARLNEVDLVIMDIDMPGMNGVEATLKIRALRPEIKVIALTMFCNPLYIYEISRNGARGYLLKDAPTHEISKAIYMVLNDEEYYSARVQHILAKVYRDYDESLPRYDPSLVITRAQLDVLLLLCRQHSSEEIANELNISLNTVHRHRQDLLDRTGSRNLAGLVIYAIEHGLVHVKMN